MSFLKRHEGLRNFFHGQITWTRNGNKNAIGYITSLTKDLSYIQLIYKKTNSEGNSKDLDYKIRLITTPCNYGGKRYWFICPLSINGKTCLKKVGVLYKPYYADYFGCRHCYNLTYNSRNIAGFDKKVGRIISIPELEEMENQVKRKYYNGEITKKHKKYLIKARKSQFAVRMRLLKLNAQLAGLRGVAEKFLSGCSSIEII